MGSAPAVGADQLYRISYDGSIVDERRFVVMGGATEPVITALTASFTAGWDLTTALGCGRQRRSAPQARVRRAQLLRRSSRWRCSIAPWPAAPSAASRVLPLAALLAPTVTGADVTALEDVEPTGGSPDDAGHLSDAPGGDAEEGTSQSGP